MGWEMRGRFKREGAYAYLWLIHIDVWQKPTLYCKAIIFQLKINLKNDHIHNASSLSRKLLSNTIFIMLSNFIF